MRNCKHTNTKTGEMYGYRGSVATPRKTDENRAAHGGVRYTETCAACGMTRAVNANGTHHEYAAWSLPDCSDCNGTGLCADDDRTGIVGYDDCETCKGTGKVKT